MALRVLIIHPSGIMQAALRRLIDRPGQVLVTGFATDVDSACELIRNPDHTYDVILLEMTHARAEGSVAKLVEQGNARVIVMSPTEPPRRSTCGFAKARAACSARQRIPISCTRRW